MVWYLAVIFAGICEIIATWYGAWSYEQTHRFKVVFLDIGQGDSTLIQFRNGQKMLVDCGANSLVVTRLGAEIPFYNRTIDYLVVTHPDLDHYGGCVDVVKRYRVGTIITNGKSKPNDSFWQTWDAVVLASGAARSILVQPKVWNIASTTLEFLSPDPALSLKTANDDSNNYSIVFRLLDKTNSYLFTADAELPLEQALLKKYCPEFLRKESNGLCPVLRSNILKVGHHGSKTSTSDEFLRAVAPAVGVISVGPNKYGHPSLRVLKRLERSGARVLRTDVEGAILME